MRPNNPSYRIELNDDGVTCTAYFIGDDGTAPFAEDQGRGFVLDMDKVNLASHKNPTFHPLPDLGGGPRGYVEARCALRVLNPIGLGQFNTALS